MSRFNTLFEQKKCLAFLPFFILGYPKDEYCLKAIDAAIDAGADALELGIPFSDPIADGPIIQAATQQVLTRDFSTHDAFCLIEKIRQKHPSIPIGLLVYSQTIEHFQVGKFFHQCSQVGVDGVLIADVPIYESQPYREIAQVYQVDLVHLAAPTCNQSTLQSIAQLGAGFTYVVTRSGVTGLDKNLSLDNLQTQVQTLNKFNAPPPVLGFGIQSKKDIEMAQLSGAKGFIIGSKLVDTISKMSQSDFEECKAIRELINQLDVPKS